MINRKKMINQTVTSVTDPFNILHKTIFTSCGLLLLLVDIIGSKFNKNNMRKQVSLTAILNSRQSSMIGCS